MNFGGPDDLTLAHQGSPSALLGGRYELRRMLGSGGMAEVHLAHDLRLDRGVAVKTLRDALHSGPPLTVERALEVTAGILRALTHSHQHGIVHRDIKPANVMLTWAGEVKVMDFGIARDARDTGMTQTSVVIGTAQYLSPEQAMGQDIDARSDLYSTGCLLYELLTFRTPFTGDTPMSVMYQHIQEAPRPPSLFNPEVGPQVDAIVLRALEKDPDRRHRSADHMLGDIEAYLDTRLPISGAEPPTAEQDVPYDDADSREKGRRRGNVALASASLVVVVLALAVGWFLFGRSTPGDGKVDVPDLVGQTLEDARSTAGNVDLTVTVAKQEPCTDQPKGHVCEQSPVDGEIAKGEAVSVTVSTGAPKVEVPDVTDKNEDDASRILEDKGFKVKLRRVESEEDPGTVLRQNPDGGAQAEKGTEITLTVAEEARKSTVPDLSGATVSQARELLAAQNLKLGSTTEVESGSQAGTVVEQGIASGEEVKPGTAVAIKIAKAVRTVRIPSDIVGKTLAEVQEELGSLGLQVSVATGYSQASDAVVASSTPAAGSEVTAGSTVVLVTQDVASSPSDGDTSTSGGTATSPAAQLLPVLPIPAL
ncbi:Stk1 family PASTA domain-containing Ser/Thr kinase [Streptomyces acidiscabies]|uniref:Stk1 family PASTA domain-containing Ser/Thr kinase n=1 Tax=Streptomyces acidiscabies TaxID=42234 RepID=UPI00073F5F16|nr:Stk1 family PASTA domain-containing Ser/Thr kinase [Streptomyces acidiscabies]GAQ57611.1 serine/threonine-protein kinase PknB [Streptomyces acidiscabies]